MIISTTLPEQWENIFKILCTLDLLLLISTTQTQLTQLKVSGYKS